VQDRWFEPVRRSREKCHPADVDAVTEVADYAASNSRNGHRRFITRGPVAFVRRAPQGIRGVSHTGNRMKVGEQLRGHYVTT
jgi:hypothetical protein